MSIVKSFLGNDQSSVSIDEDLFNRLFYAGANNDLFIIKSKIPIPNQDIGDQHDHENFEFTIPLSHSPKLLIENKPFTLPRRNIFPTNPGQSHGPAEVANQHRIIALQISVQELKKISSSLFGKSKVEFLNTPVPIDPHIDNLIDMFLYESIKKQAGYEFILEHTSSLLGAKILRTLKSNLDLKEKHFNSVSKKEINRALDYLHSNINQEFSLENISELTGLSKYHFIRVFKKETGKTPYQYYTDLKIEKAIELIKMNNYSITEICFMCGFKDHSHFSRVFLKKTGFTPSHYKDLCV